MKLWKITQCNVLGSVKRVSSIDGTRHQQQLHCAKYIKHIVSLVTTKQQYFICKHVYSDCKTWSRNFHLGFPQKVIKNERKMYLMYTLNENGERVYTLKVFKVFVFTDEKIKLLDRNKLNLCGITIMITVNHIDGSFLLWAIAIATEWMPFNSNWDHQQKVQFHEKIIKCLYFITETNRRRYTNHIGASR